MASVSDKPWGGFSQADYTPRQWHDACLVCMPPAAGQDQYAKDLCKLPVREPDGTLNRNAVHAAAGAHGISAVKGISADERMAVAKTLVGLYHQIGDDPPMSLMQMAGMGAGRSTTVQVPLTYQRTFTLEGIEVISRAKGGDGRTVEAYAAVFDIPTEVHDQHGDYVEVIDQKAFNREIANGVVRRAQVLLNHGFDAQGGTGGMQQAPLGSPVDIKADGRGLLTVSRYNDGPLSEQVLAGIRNGDYRAQSFQGPIRRSDPQRPPGRARANSNLPTVRRLELGLKNYGPTMDPYYPQAEITAVRSVVEIVEDFARLDEAGREQLMQAMLADPELARMIAAPHRGLGAEDSRARSVRQSDIARQRQNALWAELALMEMATNAQTPK